MLIFFWVSHVAAQAKRITWTGAKIDARVADRAIPTRAAPMGHPQTRWAVGPDIINFGLMLNFATLLGLVMIYFKRIIIIFQGDNRALLNRRLPRAEYAA